MITDRVVTKSVQEVKAGNFKQFEDKQFLKSISVPIKTGKLRQEPYLVPSVMMITGHEVIFFTISQVKTEKSQNLCITPGSFQTTLDNLQCKEKSFK